MKRVYLLLLMAILLVGCQKEIELAPPKNITQTNLTLSWDSVEGASHYSVSIDDDTEMVSDTTFSLEPYENGSYTVKIRALNQETISEYSDDYTVVINRTFEHPTDLNITDDVLSWNDTDALSYRVYTDDTTFVTTNLTQYDLTELEMNNTYYLKIQAIYDLGESALSPSVTYHIYEDVNRVYELTLNTNSTLDALITLDEAITFSSALYQDDTLDASSITVDGVYLTIDHSLYETLQLGESVMFILCDEGKIQINLTIKDDLMPYIASNQLLTYHNEDVIVHIETFSKGIQAVSGNDITSDDYTFSEGILTLNASYFEIILTDNPDRQRVILAVPLYYGNDDILITYLFIDMP